MAEQEYGPGQKPTVGKTVEQQRREYLEALNAERVGYVQRGLDDRVAAVDVEIRRLTQDARPAQKATRQVKPKSAESSAGSTEPTRRS